MSTESWGGGVGVQSCLYTYMCREKLDTRYNYCGFCFIYMSLQGL